MQGLHSIAHSTLLVQLLLTSHSGLSTSRKTIVINFRYKFLQMEVPGQHSAVLLLLKKNLSMAVRSEINQLLLVSGKIGYVECTTSAITWVNLTSGYVLNLLQMRLRISIPTKMMVSTLTTFR